MPYALQGRCIINKATGEQVKCHPTRARAMRHLAALQANVPEAKAAPATSAGSRPMTRAEAARHASLVRWKKESPLAANVQERLAQIRAARMKKGKGGKGKAKGGKPKAAPKPKETRTKQEIANQNRAAVSKETGMADLEGPLVRIGAGMSSDLEPEAYGKLIEKGLAKRLATGKTVLTPAGKKFRRAADKGDADGAREALIEGAGKAREAADKDAARQQKKTEREQARAERAKARDKRKAERGKGKEKAGPKDVPGPKPAPVPMPAQPTEPAPRRPRQTTKATEYTTMSDYAAILDDLAAIRGELADVAKDDTATKAGRRNNSADQAQIDQGYELAMQLCDLFESLGADTGEEEGEEETGMGEEMMESEAPMKDAAYILDGDAIKALGDDRIGAYAVRFGDETQPDLSTMRDYFTKATDYWIDAWDRRPMLYHHAMDEDTEDAPRIGTWVKAEVKDEGVWLEGQLDRHHRYYTAIKELVRRGALRLSSDSAPHLVRRATKAGGVHEVTRWPILAASLTPTPAEPRLSAVSFKALMAELGLDDTNNPQADDDAERERQDAAKALADRQRRLLLELDLEQLALEATTL